MSIILRLWDPRKDDDVITYDFYDLDESAKDDGSWSFKSLDNDSPGDPDNDKLEKPKTLKQAIVFYVNKIETLKTLAKLL